MHYVKLDGKFTWMEIHPLNDEWAQITHLVNDMRMAEGEETRTEPLYDWVHHPIISRSGNIIMLLRLSDRTVHRYNRVTTMLAKARYLTLLGHNVSMDLTGEEPELLKLVADFVKPEAYTPISDEPEKE